MIIILTISAVISVFLPQSSMISIRQELPASKEVIALVNALIMLVLYGGLGYIGLKLSIKLGFAELWDKKVNNKQRFLYPAIYGIIAGFLLIIFDYIFSFFNGIGKLIHPPFPTSLFASITAGIGEEVIFRLFFISFWVWLISGVILKGKFKNKVFWVVTFLSAIAFAGAHLPSIMFIVNIEQVSNLSLVLIIEIFLLNSFISFPAAYYFRKYGILAAVGIHFWADIIWHVIYGLF
jgi:hypothetical protein